MKLSYLFQKSLYLILLFTLSQCAAVRGSVQMNALWGKTDLVLAHYEDCRKRNDTSGNCDINQRDPGLETYHVPGKNSVLHLAVITGNLFLVKQLLNWGADPKNQNKDGDYPINFIFECRGINNCTEIYNLLIESGSPLNPSNYEGLSLLHRLSNCKIEECLSLMNQMFTHASKRKEKIDVNVQLNNKTEFSGMTPLLYASINGLSKIVTLLLSKGADPNLSGKNIPTPLMMASLCTEDEPITDTLSKECISIINQLIEKGANVNGVGRGEHSGTALVMAARTYHYEAIEVLLNKGAYVNSLRTSELIKDKSLVRTSPLYHTNNSPQKKNVEYNRFEKTTSLLSNAGGIDVIKSVNEIDKWTPPAKDAAERKKACAWAKAESLSCDEPDPLGGKGGALCKHIYHTKEVMCAGGA